MGATTADVLVYLQLARVSSGLMGGAALIARGAAARRRVRMAIGMGMGRERLVDDLANRRVATPATGAATEAFVDGARRAWAKLAAHRVERGSNHRIGHNIARAYDHRAPET
jgi:hypothetical protein